MLVIHEVMGRHCGWLTAATAQAYRQMLDDREWLDAFGVPRARRDVHAVYVPEMEIDIDAEASRLSEVMNTVGNVNIFLSEGAGIDAIVEQMESRGEEVPRDPFGHVKLDLINPGNWFGKQFGPLIGAEKVLVQKSGYYARAAAAGERDLHLIRECVEVAVSAAFAGTPGLVGHDEERGNELRAIEFPRIKGAKPFDVEQSWFIELLEDIAQPKGRTVAAH